MYLRCPGCRNKDAQCRVGCEQNPVDSNFGICISLDDFVEMQGDLAKIQMIDDNEHLIKFLKHEEQELRDAASRELDLVVEEKENFIAERHRYSEGLRELERYRDLWKRFAENPKPVSFVYIYIDIKSNTVKIGKSDNPCKRVSAYKSSSGNAGLLYAQLECPPEEVQETEREIQNEFYDFSIHGEWYKPPVEFLEEILKKYKFDILLPRQLKEIMGLNEKHGVANSIEEKTIKYRIKMYCAVVEISVWELSVERVHNLIDPYGNSNRTRRVLNELMKNTSQPCP